MRLLAGPAAITSVMVFSDFYDLDVLFLNVGFIFIAMLTPTSIKYTTTCGLKFINYTIQR